VGDGPERSMAEKYCRDKDLMNQVTFVGRQDNVPDLMSCADVLLLPSETESFGLVALEAMSCEVPVVATNVGGLPEVVIPDETGYLAPVGDVDTMSSYCLEIINDRQLREKMGKAGRERAASVFDQKKIVPLYEKFYEKVLSSKKS
jgi:N-acetyl-alpha-D-glucosaminyl L-malate synthase BshA